MPIATAVNGYSLLNNGPLTTTFSAPSACITDNVVLAPASLTYPIAIAYYASCDYTQPASCRPSGRPYEALVSKLGHDDPQLNEEVVYYSPGLICPAGWTTAGMATKDASSSLTMSGALDVTSYLPTATGRFFADPAPAVLVDALDAGETAVLCCPSSFTALNGACYSILPTAQYTPTFGCLPFYVSQVESVKMGTYTIEGQAVTGGLIEITASGSQPVSSMTTEFSASEASSYVGVVFQGAMMLVHQASDVTATGAATGAGATGTGSGAAATGTGAATTTTTKSSAARSSVRDYSDKTLGVAAAGCIALVLGSLFVL
ncbi:hypothetical protein SBRCBS47491_009984 [Sporothrix bragantina]|uniref:Uncharacterized protein n=1 Tax=Sporothrix bragantina TaxID=671064 RepID=A0ABP0D112_9PEZI